MPGKKRNFYGFGALLLLALAVAVTLWGPAGQSCARQDSKGLLPSGEPAPTLAPMPKETQAEHDARLTPVVRAVRAVAPAVVNITVTRVAQGGQALPDDLLAPFFAPFLDDTPGARQVQRSLGSGVIISGKDALVLTNAHVIDGASDIKVKLLDGRSFAASLIASNPDFDLAVLRLKGAKDLPQAEMGDSSDLMPGETVIAIGNPYGFGHTVTTGVVSALKRSVRTDEAVFTDFIQTDAAINPGNSGGPLINILGRVIGITTAIKADAQGIGFAIPVNKARRAVEQLVAFGRIKPLWLGLIAQDVDQGAANYFGLNSVQGVIVTRVFAHTPAAKAGLTQGDVILSVNGAAVEDREHFLGLVRDYGLGGDLTLGVLRKGQTVDIKARPEMAGAEQVDELAYELWGFKVGTASGNGHGLPVTAVRAGGPAARLGLTTGDRILGIGDTQLSGLDDFIQGAMRFQLARNVIFMVERNGRAYYVRLWTS